MLWGPSYASESRIFQCGIPNWNNWDFSNFFSLGLVIWINCTEQSVWPQGILTSACILYVQYYNINLLAPLFSYKYTKARNIHHSSIMPPRSHDQEILESVKHSGIQQPLIVRPLPSNTSEYELIDGSGRFDAVDPEEEVYIDVRSASDVEVFKISEATSKRTSRNTREKASFYAAYVEVAKKETEEKGVLARVTAETQISESELSQLVTINKLFLKLAELEPEAEFEQLQTMGINKLYKLSQLLDNAELLATAHEIEKKAETLTLERLSAIVNNIANRNSLIEKLLGDDEPTNSTSYYQKENATSKTKLTEMSGKISKMKEKLDVTLQNIKIESLPTAEPILEILEKMLVSFRRLTYYSRRLQKAQEEIPSEKE